MRAKAMLVLCTLMGMSPIAFIGWYRWDSAQNRGFESGYFGEFNRVRHALDAIPGITVVDAGANHDLTLEEFEFHITTSRGQRLHLAFAETDPIRNLSGHPLTAVLTAMIQQKTPSTSSK
jgi:hypothetical protein